MKKLAFTITILLSISGLFAQSRIISDMEPFTTVDIHFIGDVVIKQSTTNHEVIIKASDYSFIEHTHADVKDGKLSIYMDKKAPQGKTDIRIEIRLPHLEELSLSGPGDVTVEKRNEPQLTVINAGAGDCTLQCLKVEKSLELHNKSAGSISVPVSDAIRQETLLIHNSGAGDVVIHASSTSNSLIVNNKGAGDISVNTMSIPIEEMILRNQSAGKVTMQNIWAKRLELRNQGAGDIKMMNGKADEMTLESAGAGNAHLLLKVTTAHITHAGVGNIIATVTGTAYVTDKSELGKVTIHGGGKIIKE
jgi:hypothetical protein